MATKEMHQGYCYDYGCDDYERMARNTEEEAELDAKQLVINCRGSLDCPCGYSTRVVEIEVDE